MNVKAKNCNDMPTMKRCMAAVLASEQLRLVTRAIDTCQESHLKLEQFQTDFRQVEDTMADLFNKNDITNLRGNLHTTSLIPKALQQSQGSNQDAQSDVMDKFVILQEKVDSMFSTLTILLEVCAPFRNDIEVFWNNFEFSQKEIVDMIRNPGPHLMKVDIRLKDMTFTEVKQIEAYPWTSLIGDIGGTLGLCLGGSVLTLVEVIDVIISWFLYRNKDGEGEERSKHNGDEEHVAKTEL